MAQEERWYPVIPGKSNDPKHYIAIGNKNARKKLAGKWVLGYPPTKDCDERFLYRVTKRVPDRKTPGHWWPAIGSKLYEVSENCIFETEQQAWDYKVKYELTPDYWFPTDNPLQPILIHEPIN